METNEKTLQNKYDYLIEIFGSEKELRSELTDWFRYFAEHSEEFKMEAKNDYVFRYSQVIEFFVNTNKK